MKKPIVLMLLVLVFFTAIFTVAASPSFRHPEKDPAPHQVCYPPAWFFVPERYKACTTIMED